LVIPGKTLIIEVAAVTAGTLPIEQEFPDRAEISHDYPKEQPTFSRNSASKELSKLLDQACERSRGVAMQVRIPEAPVVAAGDRWGRSLFEHARGCALNAFDPLAAVGMLAANATCCSP